MRERLGCDHTGVSRPQDNDGLRAAAFSLFGALAGCMKRRQAFYKIQVRQSLGTLLLHLEDPNPQVAKVRTGDTDFLSPARSPQSSPRGTLPFLCPVVTIPSPPLPAEAASCRHLLELGAASQVQGSLHT